MSRVFENLRRPVAGDERKWVSLIQRSTAGRVFEVLSWEGNALVVRDGGGEELLVHAGPALRRQLIEAIGDEEAIPEKTTLRAVRKRATGVVGWFMAWEVRVR